MEDLNKNQIVLLTLLVSFVTSIATGIITVSLLQEAPLEVTRNINRIVEKTIETITPATPTPGKEVTTIVVKEEDQVIDSINKNIKSIVRIYEKDAETGETGFYGMGLVVSKDGYISADRRTITKENTYSVVMDDDKTFTITPTGVDKQTDSLLFKVVVPEKTQYTFTSALLSDSGLKLGQTLIGIGGEETNAISIGRVVSLDMKTSGTSSSTTKYLSGIETDLSSRDLVGGSPLLNLSGDVVGIKLSGAGSTVFYPTALLKKEIDVLIDSVKTP